MAVQLLRQDQVPDGMVGNVPWGKPLEVWSDRMIERGLFHMQGGKDGDPTEALGFFPKLYRALADEARSRGIDV